MSTTPPTVRIIPPTLTAADAAKLIAAITARIEWDRYCPAVMGNAESTLNDVANDLSTMDERQEVELTEDEQAVVDFHADARETAARCGATTVMLMNIGMPAAIGRGR
jgi:hypothetical protein